MSSILSPSKITSSSNNNINNLTNISLSDNNDSSNNNQLIEYICVIGFHHQYGNKLEHIYPEVDEVNKNRYEWSLLPFLALPDGVHNSQEDYCFFVMNELNAVVQPGRRLYGIAQFKQVNKSDLPAHALSESDTRQSVQKSICVLSSFPIFYTFKTQLSVASYCYFNQGDFNNIDLLVNWYKQQNAEFDGKCQNYIQSTIQSTATTTSTTTVEHEIVSNATTTPKIPIPVDFFLGPLSLKMFITHFGRNSLTLFKLVMLERGIIVFNPQPINAVCESIMAVVSLFPRLFDDLISNNALINKRYRVDWRRKQNQHPAQYQQDQLDEYALPLHLFSSKYLLHPYLSLHQLSLLSPSTLPVAGTPSSPSTLTGSGGRIINNYKGFLVGTSNGLFLKAPPQTTHAIVDIQSSEIIYRDESLLRIMELTSSDRRFIDNIINSVRDHQGNQYQGSDQWIRDQFEHYIVCLVAQMATLLKIEAGKTIITNLDSVQQYNEWWIRSWATTRNFNLWRSQLYKVNPTPQIPSKYPIHPSGPPSDILDNIQDKFSNSMKDLSGISKALFGASSFLFSSGQSLINKVIDDEPNANQNNNNNNNNNSISFNSINSNITQQNTREINKPTNSSIVEGEVEEIMKESWVKVQENSYAAATKAANAMKPLMSSGKVLAKQLSSSFIQMVAPDPNHQNNQETNNSNSNSNSATNTSKFDDSIEVDINSPNTLTQKFQQQQQNIVNDSFSKMELLEEIDGEEIYEL